MDHNLKQRLKSIAEAQKGLDETSIEFQVLEQQKQKLLKEAEIKRTRLTILRPKLGPSRRRGRY